MKLILVILSCFFALSAKAEYFVLQQQDTMKIFQTEVANTPEKRSLGLMYRKDIPDDYGMFFVFPQKKVVTMWMKNTYIPLEMLFLDENGKIIHIIKDAKPLDETLLSSEKPCSFVVEVKKGFCEKNNVQIGQVIARLYEE